MNIDLLTTGFAVVSTGLVGTVGYRLRRRPVVWLLRHAERRVASIHATLNGLREVLDAAQAVGDAALHARLVLNYERQRAMLFALDGNTGARAHPAAPCFVVSDEIRAAA